MSIQAIAWAFTQDIKPSTAKFVFVGFCNFVQENGTAWCSLSTLSSITSQDIKTVRRGIRALEKLGYIRSTGKKAGLTRQIPLYEVRLPDAVVLRLRKGTYSPSKGYQKRSLTPTQNGTRSIKDPLLTSGDKQQQQNVERIAEHLANLKKVCK